MTILDLAHRATLFDRTNRLRHPRAAALRIRDLAITIAFFGTACGTPFERALWLNIKPGNWIESRAGNFSIVSNAEAATATDFAEKIELLRAVVRETTNFSSVDARVPTRLFLFDHIFGAGHFLPGKRTLGFYLPTLRGAYIVATAGQRVRIRGPRGYRVGYQIDRDLTRAVVLHEYTHLLLRNGSSTLYPKWYDEGMAEMLSNVLVREDVVEIGRIPKSRRAKLDERLPLVSVLMAKNLDGWSDDEAGSFYAQSWALVNMLHAGHLVGGPNRNKEMRNFLRLLNDGVSLQEASLEAFDASIWLLEDDYVEYLEKGQFPYLTLPLEDFAIEEPPPFEAWPRREVLVALGELSIAVGRFEQARLLYREALSADANDPAALAGLAIAYSQQGRLEDADLYTARAEAAAPDDAEVLTSIGEAVLIRASDPVLSQERRNALILRARGYLERSIQLAPNVPGAYALMGISYIGTSPDVEPGIRSLERAREIFPSNTRLYLFLGQLYQRAGKPDLARKRLEVVTMWSHGGSDLEQASALLAQLGQPES